jgi:hypothetical protein
MKIAELTELEYLWILNDVKESENALIVNVMHCYQNHLELIWNWDIVIQYFTAVLVYQFIVPCNTIIQDSQLIIQLITVLDITVLYMAWAAACLCKVTENCLNFKTKIKSDCHWIREGKCIPLLKHLSHVNEWR